MVSCKTIEFDGEEYPLVKVEVSRKSCQFHTGKHKIVDAGGQTSSKSSTAGNSLYLAHLLFLGDARVAGLGSVDRRGVRHALLSASIPMPSKAHAL
jgi:hypothetical protein